MTAMERWIRAAAVIAMLVATATCNLDKVLSEPPDIRFGLPFSIAGPDQLIIGDSATEIRTTINPKKTQFTSGIPRQPREKTSFLTPCFRCPSSLQRRGAETQFAC